MSENKTNVNFSQINLKKVEFKRCENIENKEYKIELKDSIKIVNVNDKSFGVEYSRQTISSEPFMVHVCFDFIVYLDKTGIDFYSGDIDKIKKFAELRKAEVVNNLNLPSRASLLIANIINELGTPFISSPNVINNK